MTCQQRSRERGAALVVVVLLLAALTSIGLFAARSASIANMASGYDRQAGQTHYVAEYGVLGVIDELSGPRRSWYLNQMVTADTACTTLIKDSAGNVVAPNATCYRFGYKDLETNLLAGVSGKQLVDPAGLGQAAQIADFVIEMSDRAPASNAVAGMARSGDLGQVNMKYWNVTLTATGQVRPTATYDPLSATTTHESMRFHLTVGPF